MVLKYLGFLLVISAVFASAKDVDKSSETKSTSNQPGSENEIPELFLIAKGTGLWEMITDRNGSYFLRRGSKNVENALAVDYHYQRNLLIWSTWDGEFYVSPISGPNEDRFVNRIYRNREWYPISIAVDWLSNIIYVIEARTNTLQTLTIEGEYLTNLIRSFDPLLADGYKPRQIEVDPFEGYLFLLDDTNEFKHLFRMRLDGSDIERIDPESFSLQKRIGGMMLDIQNKKILVASIEGNAVYSLDYNGKDTSVVLKAKNYGYSMSANKRYLYGVNVTSYTSNLEYDKTELASTTVYRCEYANLKISSESCRQLSSKDWGIILQLKSVNPDFQRTASDLYVPCSYENRKCAEVCINAFWKGSKEFVCRCKLGRRLANDSIYCEDLIDDFMVYENDDIVGGVDLKDASPSLDRVNNEVFSPFKIQLQRTPGEQYGFDFDPRVRSVYYSGFHSIMKRNFGSFDTLPVVSDPQKNYGLLAMDWLTQNLYFVEMSRAPDSRSFKYAIAVATIPVNQWIPWEGPGQRRTSAFVKRLQRDVGKVQSLVVHPRRGFVFYAALDDEKQRYVVSRINSDGSNLVTLSDLGDVQFIAVDYETDKLYYIDGAFIYLANLDGTSIEKVTQLPSDKNLSLRFVNGFAVHGKWIYAKDTDKIIRYEKDSRGASWRDYDPYPFNSNMKTQVRFNIAKIGEYNSCELFNGGCKQICFSLPTEGGKDKWNTVCGCDDDYKLNQDGKTCDTI